MSHFEDFGFKLVTCKSCGKVNRIIPARFAEAICANCHRPLAPKRDRAQLIIALTVAVLLLSTFFFWRVYVQNKESLPTVQSTPNSTLQSSPTISPLPSPTSDYGIVIAGLGSDKDRLKELRETEQKERNKQVKERLQQEINELSNKITNLEGPCRDFFGGERQAFGGKSKKARLVIENRTPVILNVSLIGAEGQNVSIAPGQKQNIDITAGEYGVAVVPVSNEIQPCYGKWKLANRIYPATFVVGK